MPRREQGDCCDDLQFGHVELGEIVHNCVKPLGGFRPRELQLHMRACVRCHCSGARDVLDF